MTEQLHFHFSLSCIGEGMSTHSSVLPRDGGAWWAAVYGVARRRTWLMWLSSSSSKQWLNKTKSTECVSINCVSILYWFFLHDHAKAFRHLSCPKFCGKGLHCGSRGEDALLDVLQVILSTWSMSVEVAIRQLSLSRTLVTFAAPLPRKKHVAT